MKETAIADLDVVTRDEFEAVKEIAARARQDSEALAAENARLAERLAALEARLG